MLAFRAGLWSLGVLSYVLGEHMGSKHIKDTKIFLVNRGLGRPHHISNLAECLPQQSLFHDKLHLFELLDVFFEDIFIRTKRRRFLHLDSAPIADTVITFCQRGMANFAQLRTDFASLSAFAADPRWMSGP